MNMRKPFRLTTLATAVALISACGGGDGNKGENDDVPGAPATAVPLSAKSDVQREVGGFVAVVRDLYFEGASAASAQVRSRAVRVTSSNDAVEPKAAVTQDCTLGGTLTTDSGTKSRAFQLYDVTLSVDFESEDDRNCVEEGESGPGSTTTYTGFSENGFSGVDPDGVSYGYDSAGRNGVPVTITEDDGEFVDYLELLGNIEARSSSTEFEVRQQLTLRFRGELDGKFDDGGTFVFGNETTDYVTVEHADGTLSFEGPYRYGTGECTGGALTVSTNDPVSFDGSLFPVGGSLTFTSGTASVVLVFNSDGSADYDIEGGSTGTLSRAEIEASTDSETGGC